MICIYWKMRLYHTTRRRHSRHLIFLLSFLFFPFLSVVCFNLNSSLVQAINTLPRLTDWYFEQQNRKRLSYSSSPGHWWTCASSHANKWSATIIPSITRQAALILSAIGRSVDQICGLAQMAIDVADLADWCSVTRLYDDSRAVQGRAVHQCHRQHSHYYRCGWIGGVADAPDGTVVQCESRSLL